MTPSDPIARKRQRPTREGHQMLRWIERVLLAAGVVLGAWSLLVATEARYFSALPVPRAASASLPGEEPRTSDRGHPAPSTAVDRGAWIGRLEVPAVHLSATVLEGSDDETLMRAAGHIENTSLPGPSGNVGVAGHRDTTFRPLRNITVGDVIALTTAADVYEYRVVSTAIVAPDAVYVLNATAEPILTLVTCYPFTYIGHAPQRFIVKAKLVGRSER